MYGVTPAEIQSREEWTNTTMEQRGVPFRVCLHPDTTVSVRGGITVLECDYCPAWSASVRGVPDHPATWLWQE